MLGRIFNSTSNTIASAAIIVASFSVLSRIVGFARDRILAGAFGASDALDIYFAAFRIPDFLFQLLVVGAISASFIPLFTKYWRSGSEDGTESKKENQKAWKLTNNLLNIIAIIFGIALIFAFIFAYDLAPLIAPGFDAEKQVAVAEMTRIMFLAQFVLAVSMIFSSVLQGVKRFVIYSIAPILYNVGIILGALVFVPIFGDIGLAWGVVLGALMHFATQLIGVLIIGYRYMPILEFKDPDFLYTLKHMLPRVMGLAVNQVNYLAMTIIASTLAVGSVTILQFAYNLNFFPVGIIAVSYAIAAYPTFCELVNQKKMDDFVKSFSSAIRQTIFFIIPATMLFILLRAQIVRVVLGAGEFDWEATILTANTLGFFAISFLAQSLIFVIVRAYFAHGDTLTPFIVGLVSAATNIVLALFITPIFGVAGLAVAFSGATVLQLVLLWSPLRARTGTLDELHIARSIIVLTAAAIIGAFATQGIKHIVGDLTELDTFMSVLGQGFAAGTVGFASYCAVAYLMKSEEMTELIIGLKRRLIKKAKPAESMPENF